MSKQAIASEKVCEGLKEVLLGPAQLYEALKDRANEQGFTRGACTGLTRPITG
jgi:type I restriction enzyme R subunit